VFQEVERVLDISKMVNVVKYTPESFFKKLSMLDIVYVFNSSRIVELEATNNTFDIP